MYHINDGISGSFVTVLATHIQYIPKKLISNNEKCSTSSIWGPTCAPLDRIVNDYSLPEVCLGCLYLIN